ncbi:glycosyltransferase [Sphingomonas aerophila]|uniref:Glycosyltransferase involved in cell wall biosynthesis n=1 Tax=Sphingomonas aerophila TaxID=1344948 RepID=A0A7W9BCV2_9SPHN|nr:glycosyltransferase involved in cell wall biosynthesis [Sphingomonas aerophila]
MTRLLMTCDAVGGVWQYASDLAAALVPLDVETVLAVLGPVSDDAASPAGIRLIETGLQLDWLADGPAPVLESGEAIASLAREVGADLVQLNSPTLAAQARFDVPVVAVAHGCVSTWWQAARPDPLDPAFAWHAQLSRRGLLAADAVVVPSAAYAATIADTYSLPQRPIAVHNGRPAPGPVLGSVTGHAFTAGRLWDAAKGTEILDRAAARLAAPIRAAGPLIAPHGEEVTVTHLQPLGTLDASGVAAELACRPVYVSSATFEPFGLAVLEAAGAGCPLVLSDIPTFRELWDGVATFVDPTDEEGFATEIARLIADPVLADRLGRAAAARAGRYTPDKTAAAMAAIYAKLTDNRARAA